jgi:tRNA pseudouridine synthase 9
MVNPMEKSRYFVDDEMRYVNPYDYEYKTFTKGRWINKQVFEVFKNEFKAYSSEYYVN